MRTWLAIVLLGCLSACSAEIKLPDAPKDLIPRDTMVVLLKDLTILESGIQNRYQNVSIYYKVMTASGKAYLKSKNIDPKRFERSFDYYVAHSEELQSIYQEVIDDISSDLNHMNVSSVKPDSNVRITPNPLTDPTAK